MKAIRIGVAILLFIHGAYRVSDPEHVALFGSWLDSIGAPIPVVLAWSVTIFELLGPVLLVANRLVLVACAGHIVIIATGALLVHRPSGWFVVGAGRNGVEYSALLLLCLISTAHQSRRQ